MMIQYDGTRYHGWQRQTAQKDTIQGRIEQVLSRMYGRSIEIDGAGRTDAGVHARCQVANVHLEETPEPERLQELFNVYLPEDIRIMKVEKAGERFHSRLNVTAKTYQYRLIKAGSFDVFARRYSWQMTEMLSVSKMKEAAQLLIGQHDFKGFCTKASKKKSTVRRIDRIEIRETQDSIFLVFEGSGFLYHMVRILTGTLVEIGMGKRDKDTIPEILKTGNRNLAGVTAPAQGLTLWQVRYD